MAKTNLFSEEDRNVISSKLERISQFDNLSVNLNQTFLDDELEEIWFESNLSFVPYPDLNVNPYYADKWLNDQDIDLSWAETFPIVTKVLYNMEGNIFHASLSWYLFSANELIHKSIKRVNSWKNEDDVAVKWVDKCEGKLLRICSSIIDVSGAYINLHADLEDEDKKTVGVVITLPKMMPGFYETVDFLGTVINKKSGNYNYPFVGEVAITLREFFS